MNCEEFESHLADALGNELSAEVRVTLLEHMQRCAKCRDEYESAAWAVDTMRALPGPARIQMRRESGRLVFEQAASPAGSGPRSILQRMFDSGWSGQVVRYAATILLGFTAGYLFRPEVASSPGRDGGRSVSMEGARMDRNSTHRDVQQVLAGIYARNPVRSDLAKALIAVTSHTP